MPEGDSVYRLAARLRPLLDGRELVRGELRVPVHGGETLAGDMVTGHDTHGKHLLTRLASGRTLHTHMRMEGSWATPRPGRRLPRAVLPDVRVLLETAGGRHVYGVSLPVVDLAPTAREAEVVGFLGPDPLRADWDAGVAATRVAREPGREVIEAIRDQRNLAGLGNLWVNELCFLRGLHPKRPVGDVDVEPLLALAARALRRSASQPSAYQITTGNRRPGEQHWVVGRAGRPCLRCGTIVVAEGAFRGGERQRMWWCPHCQPA